MARVFSRHFGLQASTIVNSHSITIIPSPSCGLQGHAADVDTGPQRRPGPAPQQQEGYPPSTWHRPAVCIGRWFSRLRGNRACTGWCALCWALCTSHYHMNMVSHLLDSTIQTVQHPMQSLESGINSVSQNLEPLSQISLCNSAQISCSFIIISELSNCLFSFLRRETGNTCPRCGNPPKGSRGQFCRTPDLHVAFIAKMLGFSCWTPLRPFISRQR